MRMTVYKFSKKVGIYKTGGTMKKIATAILSAFLILSFVSCGSKPKPEEPTTTEAPTTENTVDDTSAQTTDDVVETITATDNTVALKAVENTRKRALECGADDYCPEYLEPIDALYASIKAKADNGEDVSAELADLAKRYEALALYLEAVEAQEIIDDTELWYISGNMYDEGCKHLEKAEELFETPGSSTDALYDSALNAKVCFTTTLALVYKQVAKDERTEAFKAKRDADSVKAAVAQKEKYNEGVEYFKKGDSLYSMQAADKAYESYKASKEIFLGLYNDIADKRAAALAAIEEAKKRVAESAAYAEKADSIAPLKEKVAGIEDEDAVLLEEDNYEDPEDAEIDLDEELKEASLKDQVEGAANNLLNGLGGDAK